MEVRGRGVGAVSRGIDGRGMKWGESKARVEIGGTPADSFPITNVTF